MRFQLLNKIVPGWVQELKFHPTRRWRFDYAHPDLKIAIEIEGAVWTRGRHTRGAGYLADCEKYNTAQIMGYRVLRYATSQMAEMVDDVKKLCKALQAP